MRSSLRAFSLVLALVAMCVATGGAFAQTAMDRPSLDVVGGGHGKVRLTVTAGASGAPAGFQVSWMTAEQFAAQGSRWASLFSPGQGWADFIGTGTLNTWGTSVVDFKLAPNQSLDIEIGDTRGETGVTGTIAAELLTGTEYVFVTVAHGAGMNTDSPLSVTVSHATTTQGEDCTYTIGYWKTHPAAWPVSSLMLGSVNYSAAQLMNILNAPVAGNGLISLAHQLIAARLNLANGANPTSIAATVAAADAQIGALVIPPVGAGYLHPSTTSSKTQLLDDFNNGVSGPGHCGSTPARTSSWGAIKLIAR